MQARLASFSPDKLQFDATLSELDSPQSLVLVFAGFDDVTTSSALTSLRSAFPTSLIVGCSAAGEIVGSEVHDGVLAIAIAKFEKTSLRLAWSDIASHEGSYGAGLQVGEQLSDPDLAGVLVLSCVNLIDGAALSRGVNHALPGVAITGGLAGSGDDFDAWVAIDDKAEGGCVAGVGFYGSDVRIGHGSYGGWDAFGPQRLITKSSGSEMFELDHQPALPLFKEYLGSLAAGLPQTGLRFPLAIRQCRLTRRP